MLRHEISSLTSLFPINSYDHDDTGFNITMNNDTIFGLQTFHENVQVVIEIQYVST